MGIFDVYDYGRSWFSFLKNERNNRVIVGGRYSRLAPQPDKEKY